MIQNKRLENYLQKCDKISKVRNFLKTQRSKTRNTERQYQFKMFETKVLENK